MKKFEYFLYSDICILIALLLGSLPSSLPFPIKTIGLVLAGIGIMLFIGGLMIGKDNLTTYHKQQLNHTYL